MKKRGFTLIELLAVIVILAVIALIATPIILSILTKVRKSAFQDSAYGIMEAAKSYFAETIIDDNNPVEQVFSFGEGETNYLSYSGSKPKGGMLVLSKTGEIELAIHNNEWCAIKSKTESNVKLIKYEKDKCKISGEVELPLITVKDKKSEIIEKGLNKSILEYFNIVSGTATCIDTSNENAEVTNTSSLSSGTHYIECTVTENGKTVKASKAIVVESSGKLLTEEMMIVEVGLNGTIRTDNLGNKRYAGSDPNNYICFGTQNEICDDNHLYRIIGVIDGNVKIIKNKPYGYIEWDRSPSNNWNRPSTLKTELNGGKFYSNAGYIDEISRDYIVNSVWHTGGQRAKVYTLSSFEDNERNTSSKGYIGLMSVTDYGYASNDAGCTRFTNLRSVNNVCVNKNNWLVNDFRSSFTITPDSTYTDQINVWSSTEGSIINVQVYSKIKVYPSLFLKPEVKITSGKGTETEPYRLSM